MNKNMNSSILRSKWVVLAVILMGKNFPMPLEKKKPHTRACLVIPVTQLMLLVLLDRILISR